MKQFYLLFILCLLSVSNHAWGQASSARLEALRFIREGDNQLSFGNWDQAILMYSNAVDADKDYADAHMKLASILEKTGRYQESLIHYNRAIRLNPYADYIYDKRAKMRMLAKDYKGALKDMETAIAINPDENAYRERRVEDLIAIGEYEAALSEIDTLSAKSLNREYDLEKKALVFFLIEDEQQCNFILDSILSDNPTSAFAYDLMGLLSLRGGENKKAIDHFTTAVELDPDYALAYYNRSIAKRLSNDPEGAIKDLNQAIAIRQGMTNVYFTRALVRKELGDIEGAIEDYGKAYQNDSTNLNALYNRAYSLKIIGDFSQAMNDAETVVQMDDQSPEHWNLKGNLHVLFNEYHEAIDCYTIAISHFPDYSEAYFNRGLAYLMSYRPIQGCSDLHESSRLDFSKAEEMIRIYCGN